jgi:hypothetical protein
MTAAEALPPLPFAVFDEFGKGADDRVQDYARAYAEAAIAVEREQLLPLRDLMIGMLNRVKAWRDCDGNDGFPADLRDEIDALILAVESGHIRKGASHD